MPSLIAPADAIRKAIEADRRRAPPIFRTNEPVGLKNFIALAIFRIGRKPLLARLAGAHRNGAQVGDLYMSLIHTCELNGANPFDYLAKLKRHSTDTQAETRGDVQDKHSGVRRCAGTALCARV